ncbi:Uncharacterised protein [Klebsiella michiganensis]|uniref:Uncharacterized protein n=1 Tax=Klebsiella michiganensis TaxID=1134687 RepID=A0A7H4LUC0_9ENTR|nr:Uncharacterised protein [Klebsiella michiganensis]
MAQQRIVGAIAQSEADFADAAGGRWPDRRLTVQLGQPFVIGKTRNAEIPLRTRLTPSRRSSRAALSSGSRAPA